MITIIEEEKMIRIANRSDINRIAEIELIVNRINYKDILSQEFLYHKISYEYNKGWLNASFDDVENDKGIEYYVIEEENIIKGYFSIGFSLDKDYECELINFMIDVPFQHNKFGTLLMDYCLKLARNRTKNIIGLKVFEKNNIAIKFYEKLGFNMASKCFSEDLDINALRYIRKIK
jgi:ribosomal protein S18 acetylase RimI-like enzyme